MAIKKVEYQVVVGTSGKPDILGLSKSLGELQGTLKNTMQFSVGLNQGLELLAKGFNTVANAIAGAIQPLIEYDSLQKKLAVSGVGIVENNKELVDSVKEIQRQFGENPTEVADALFQAIKTGAIDSADSLEYMTAITKLATSAFTDVGTTSETVSKVMNTYGKSVSDVVDISETLLIASKNSTLGFQEFSQFMGKGITVAKGAGLSFEQYAASLATVTKLGFEARQGMSAFQGVIDQVIKPSEELTKIYKELGITNISAAIKSKTFSGVLSEIIRQANASGTSLLNLFGSIESVTVATELSSGKNKDFVNTLKQLSSAAQNSGSVLDSTFQTVDSQISESLQDISARFSLLRTNIAEAFSGSTLSVIKFFADLLKGLTYIDFSSLATSLGEMFKNLGVFLLMIIPYLTAATLGFTMLAYTVFPALAVSATAVAVKLWLVVAPMAAVLKASLALVTISAGILTLAAAVDILVRNFSSLWDVVKTVFSLIMSGINTVTASIIGFVKKLGVGVGTLQKMENALDANAQVWAEWAAESGKDVDFGFAGDAIEQISNISKGFDTVTEAQKKTSSESDDLQKKIEKIKLPDFKVEDKSILNLYDQLIGKTKTLEDSIAKASMTETEYIEQSKNNNIAQIKNVENLLQAEGKLTTQRQAGIATLIDLTKKQSDIELIAAQKKLASEQLSAGIDIAKIMGEDTKVFRLEYEKQSQELKQKLDSGLIDVLQYHDAVSQIEKDASKKSIDLLRAQQSETDKLLGTGTKTFEIEYQKRLESIKELQAKGAISAPQAERATELATVAQDAQAPFMALGDAAAEGVLGTLQAGMGGLSAGFSSMMSGPIGMIAGLPDMLKSGIDSLSGFIDSWLSLPDMLMNALPDVISKLSTFFGDFLGKLGEDLPQIMMKLAKVIVEIVPKSIASIINAIPELIIGIIKAVPALVDGIINGLIDGIGALLDSIMGIFNPDTWSMAGEALQTSGTEAVDAVGKSVTGVGSQLFGFVEDSGVQQAQANARAITDASARGSGFFMTAWNALKQAGMWLWDKVLSPIWTFIFKPIVDLLTYVFWDLLWLKIFQPVTELLIFIFKDILWEMVWKPVLDLLTWIFWDLLWLTVFKPVTDLLTTIFWDILWLKVFMPVLDKLTNIFTWVNDKVFTPVVEGIRSAFTWVKENIVDPIVDAFKSVVTGAKEFFNGIKDFFSGIGDSLTTAFRGVIDKIKTFFGDLFTFAPSAGTVETWLGFDFPWVNFAEGGLVGGRAKVAGDSLANDTVPALLSAGEYVLPRSVTQDKELMGMILSLIKGMPKFATGGWVDMETGAPYTGSTSFDKVENGRGYFISEGENSKGDSVIIEKFVAATEEAYAKLVEYSANRKDSNILLDAFSGIGDALTPDWLKGTFNTLKKYVGEIPWKEFLLHPLDTAWATLKKSFGFLKDLFLPNVKTMLGFANGGFVGTDTVPAMLTPGEYVLNKNAVSSLGTGFLDRLNNGMLPSGTTTQNIELTLNIKTEQPIDERYIKQTLMPTIRDELRRMSLDGRRVLSTSGVR